jgi:hypothetical protein
MNNVAMAEIGSLPYQTRTSGREVTENTEAANYCG